MKNFSSWFSLTAALERLERDLEERLVLVEQHLALSQQVQEPMLVPVVASDWI